jgi:hypothetical protein
VSAFAPRFMSEFYDRERSSFYAALQNVRTQNMDLTGWLEFFVSGLSTQMAEVKTRGELAIRRDVIASEHGLNERQARLVEALLERSELGMDEFFSATSEAWSSEES